MNKNIYFALSLFALASGVQAANYYMTPGGAGTKSGASYANAYAYSQRATVLNTTMVAGDTLYLGSGTYNGPIGISSSGTSSSPKRLVGQDTGTGKPVIDGGTWARTAPTSGQWQTLSLNGGSSYWIIENLVLKDSRYCVDAPVGGTRTGFILRDLEIRNVGHGMYLRDCDNFTIERCTVKQYTKHGFRLEEACNNVIFKFCTADLSDGDSSWWDYSELFPIGFLVNDGGAANTNVTFEDCVAKNNLLNGQASTSYWNGDGFAVEINTNGLNFKRCIAINNEDGGYDLKQAAGSTTTMQDCVGVQNSKNYRFWHSTVNMINCVATFARKRGASSTNSKTAIWLQNATVAIDYFTGHGANDSQVWEDGTGSATLTNSILSSSVTGSTFTKGSVNLSTGSVTYQPGAGTYPNYVNPAASWDGVGNSMDNTLTPAKGYKALSGGGGVLQIFQLENESYATSSGDVVTTNAHAQASGGYYDMFTPNAIADYIAYTINVTTAGTYNVSATGMTWTSRGITKLLIDGTQLGTTWDQYGTNVTWPVKSFGATTLSAGSHTFKFEITGKRTGSTGYLLALDKLTLTP